MTTKPIRVVLVDDHQVLLGSLRDRINAEPDMDVVGTASNCDDGLRVILETRPDLAVFDIDLPGRGSFDLADELSTRQRETKVAFLTGFVSDVFISQAMQLNAAGYILKTEPPEKLVDFIRRIGAGEQCFSPEVQERLQYDPSAKKYYIHTSNELAGLTPRQLEVLRHLAQGHSVKEIARRMHLSQKSVDSHKYRIMNKLGIHDRVELARYAIREGLSRP